MEQSVETAASPDPLYVTLKQAQTMLNGVSRSTVIRYIKRGQIQGSKDERGHWRVLVGSINDFRREYKGER